MSEPQIVIERGLRIKVSKLKTKSANSFNFISLYIEPLYGYLKNLMKSGVSGWCTIHPRTWLKKEHK